MAARMLFAMHFKRFAVPLVILYAVLSLAIFQAAILIDRSSSYPGKSAMIADVLLIGIGLVAALPAGAAAFPRGFKEENILFFHSLPLSRRAQWAIIASAAFTAVLVVIVALFFLRPGTRALLMEPGGLLAAVGVTAFTFAAGICFTLAIVRPFVVYIVSFLAIFGSLFAVTVTASLPARMWLADSSLAHGNWVDLVPPPVWIVCAVVQTMAWLLASMHFYDRGELPLVKTQIRNVGIALAVPVIVAAVITPAALAFFNAREPFQRVSMAAAPDGKHVLRVERRRRAPWLSHLAIIDSAGRKRQIDITGAVRWTWVTPSIIAVASRDMGSLREPLVHVTSYSTDGRVISRATLPGETVEELGVADHHLFAVVRRNWERSLLEFDDSAFRKVLELKGPTIFDDVVIDFDWDTRRGWRIVGGWRIVEGNVVPLRWHRGSDGRGFYVFRDTFYTSLGDALRDIDTRVPIPRSANDPLAIALPPAHDLRNLFGVVVHGDRASLYTLRDGSPQWMLVTDAIPVDANERNIAAAPSLTQPLRRLRMDTLRGVALFHRHDGSVALHDAARGLTIEIARDGEASMQPADNGSWIVAGNRQWFYDGKSLHALSSHEGRLIAAAADGTEIRTDNSGEPFVLRP